VKVAGLLCAALVSGCASAAVFGPPGTGDAATEQGPGPQDLAGFITSDAAVDLSMNPMPDGSVDMAQPHVTATCASFVAPTACATSGGLNVYCLNQGAQMAFESSVSIPSSDTYVALGPGTVSSGSNLGYIGSSVPLTCATIPACTDPSSVQNTGKICDVIFGTGSGSTVTGTGLFVITADGAATPGDYLMGYLSQAVVTAPNFFIRIAP
jgi:hypothetical protein